MQFNTTAFLLYFLPPMLAVYRLAPGKARPAVLTAGSLVFYGIGTRWSLLPLAVLASMTVLAFVLCRISQRTGRRSPALVMTALTAGALAFFKYAAGGRLAPLGFSFIAFQLMAIALDTARGEAPEAGFFAFAANVTMFPKLLSGPLAPARVLEKGSKRAHLGAASLHLGLQELILGLGMKAVLADRVGGLWAAAGIMGYESLSVPFAWLALLSFAMRLYFDFWGYSIMAVGLGHMLGFDLPVNFRDPYCARSVSDFYRRWHVTLGEWFKRYVYIPLGGNRRGTLRTVLNLSLVWLLTGLWHGRTLNFLVWAGILLFFILNERLWLGRRLEKCRLAGHIYTLLAVLMSWAAFAVTDLPSLWTFYARLLGLGRPVGGGGNVLFWAGDYLPLMAAGALLATPLPGRLWRRVCRSRWVDIPLFALFWVSLYFIATRANDPFLYFQF